MSEISNNREESRENDRGKEKEPLLRRAMDAFGTIFALNVCFVVGCIPIFTVGASLSALYAMCIRLQEDEEETVVAGFIHEFKRNFKQSTIAYFFILLAIFVMYFEFLLVKRVTGFISTFYTGILVTELIFMGLIVPFLFPLIARYNNKLGTTVRNSLALAITYKGSWLKVFIAWFAPIFICVRYPIIFVNIWYLWVLFIFGAIAYGTSTTMRKIFRLNEKKLEETARKAEEEAKKAKEEAEAAAKLLEAEAEAEEKDKEDTGNKEDLDSEQAESLKIVIFPIKEVKEKSLTSFFMKKCHIYDNVIVIYSERSKKTEYLGVFMAGST